jgi:predicted MFS family arabinose efflux permease
LSGIPATGAKSTFRSALRHRDYRWLLIGHSISAIGSWAYNVALAVFVYDATGSATWVAAASLGRFVPSLLFSTYGGVIAERYERRRLLIIIDLLSLTWMTALGLLAAADGPVILAIAFAGLTTLGGTVFFPAEAALTPQLVGEEDLAAANSLNSMVGNGSVIIGPAIGAVLLALGPPEVTFFINGATFLFSAWAVSQVRSRSRSTDVTEGGAAGVLKQMSVGFKAMTSNSTAFLLIMFSVAASFLYGTDTVLFVVLSEEKLGSGPEGFGYLLAALGVGGILAAPLVNRLSKSKRLGTVIAVGMIAYGLPTLFMVWVEEPGVAFALQVVRGAGTILVDVLAITAIQRTLAPDLISRVFGVYMGLVLAAISLGAYITAPILGWIGLDSTLTLYGIVFPALVLVVYPMLVGVDRKASARLAQIQPKIDALEQVGIFAAASRPVLERLAGAAGSFSVPSGSTIIAEGAEADRFYVLTSGTVAVSAKGEGDEDRFIRSLDAVAYFGEIGLIENVPRTATVKAETDCEMLAISGDDFLAALTESPASAGFLEGAKTRLKMTHPSRELTGAAIGSGAEESSD